jgi:pyruvate,water dikinase
MAHDRPSSADATLVGVAASPGRATGPVRVVIDAAGLAAVQRGEVLVAPTTSPAWTPVFADVAAVVTDVGSLAAHAAVVAREYGIPAVVGTGDATDRLRDGMVVTVDGTAGTVHVD